MVSRQRKWQLKQKWLGNCAQCGKPRNGRNVELCLQCREKKYGVPEKPKREKKQIQKLSLEEKLKRATSRLTKRMDSYTAMIKTHCPNCGAERTWNDFILCLQCRVKARLRYIPKIRRNKVLEGN